MTEARRRRAIVTRLRTKRTLVNGLRLFWLIVVFWCEIGVFFWSIADCHWPDGGLSTHAPTTHVLLIADPQILDHKSYPGRPSWLMSLTLYIVDLNLRKSWNAVVAKLNPHVVIILGDMMDNGRGTMEEYEYDRYYTRYKSIFELNRSVPVHYLPGNHDLGLGYKSTHAARARDRYQAHFGTLNQRVEIANHTFLMIDASGLVDEDYRRHASHLDFQDWSGLEGGTVQFVRNFTQHRPSESIVLLTHIPVFRPDGTPCGPLRERGTIRPGVGFGYQNLLLRDTSTFLLESVRPSIVFSGDDHDYCERTHTLTDGSTIREVTVKSFSMAMGIQKPGFQLLSLANTATLSHASGTLADVPCLLPNQIKIYTHTYAPLAIITILLVLWINYHRSRRYHPQSSRGEHWTITGGPLVSSTNHEHQRIAPKPLGKTPDLESGPGFQEPDPADIDVEGEQTTELSSPETDDTRDSYFTSPEKKQFARNILYGNRRTSPLIVVLCCACWPASNKRAWHGRAARDLYQIAWPAIGMYFVISIWLFWW